MTSIPEANQGTNQNEGTGPTFTGMCFDETGELDVFTQVEPGIMDEMAAVYWLFCRDWPMTPSEESFEMWLHEEWYYIEFLVTRYVLVMCLDIKNRLTLEVVDLFMMNLRERYYDDHFFQEEEEEEEEEHFIPEAASVVTSVNWEKEGF